MTKTFDPTNSDIPEIDEESPPFMAAFELASNGSKLNVLFYGANGVGPHPTVILLHGYPGNEKNLDLAQALKRSGINVFFCNYRGTWGSEGLFTIDNAIADVHRFIDYLQNLPPDNDLHVDVTKIWLVGHSFGGFFALIVGSQRSEIQRVVAIAPPNLALLLSIPEVRENPDGWLQNSVVTAPLNEFMAELLEKPSVYDSFAVAEKFTKRDVLLIGAGRDEVLPPDKFHTPLVEEFTKHSSINFEHQIFHDDHSFSSHRIALSRSIVNWLNTP